MRRQGAKWSACCLLTLLPGCYAMLNTAGYVIRDVSDTRWLWGGYIPQQLYELQLDVFLWEEKNLRGRDRLFLEAPSEVGKPKSRMWGSPPSIAAYRADPKTWKEVKGIVPKGTRIQASKVEWWEGPGGEDIHVLGIITGGQFKGETVYLTDLSEWKHNEQEEVFLNSPHPDLLTPVAR